MIDSHAHLYSDQFAEDIEKVISDAKKAGVTAVIAPNVDVESIEPTLSLVGDNVGFIFPALGLHPTSIKDLFREDLIKVKSVLDKEKNIVAIGEVGLDLYWDKSYLDQQIEALNIQIGWAIERDLPVILHIRDAFDEAFELLEQYRGVIKGVCHSFTGTLEQANRMIELGLYIGINGIVTYKKSGLAEVVSEIGLDRVILETDAPYLSPTPYRGKRNESSYLRFIALKIADACQVDIETVVEKTTDNCNNLFNLR